MAPPTVKIKHLTRNPGNTRFPKLDECAHFHYENVELGPITVQLCENQSDPSKPLHLISHSANKENEADCLSFLVMVTSNDRKWIVRRTYRNFVFLDTQLHRCVYDRKYSLLQELPSAAPVNEEDEDSEEKVRNLLSEYLERFSQLAGSLINCGPVLNWLELDNRGNRLIVTDEVAINTPAVAAAYVVMRYTAQAADEISFDIGDMISVIDMPPPDESTWWRGKKGYEVGFFPSECVEVIGDKVPHSFKLSSRASTKPVFRKHGKLIAFFRSFLLSRPSRRKLKQSGILKERVFGCDLGEHLLNTGREIPLVLKCCAEFIEEFGIVDGIYRLSGVNSNIQRLRLAFDEDRATNLGDPSIPQDVHSVASLLKMYFRELPNPLLTYQLYDKFVSAVQSEEDVRLLKIRDVVQQLPPPHYRTLQYLLDHLARIASHGNQTGMTPKNIAIVWAPNLLRSREVENGGVGALHVVGVQAVLTEYLIRYADLIFDEKMSVYQSGSQEESACLRARPKSLAISTPTKLLSLEEARARALSAHLPLTQQKYIEVGGGPEKLPSKYHTVIDLPPGKHACTKLKKSPSGWKSFFSRGWYSGSARDKSRPSRNSRKASTASLPHTSTHVQDKSGDRDMSYSYPKKLRTVKSAESLIHCLKEAGPIVSEEDKSRNSPKSPQQISMDSSCFDSPYSPFPRSPSLQRHTRSSSHESYFENSIDMASEPSVEDDSSLYYFVKEQMQKFQQESESSLLWSTQDDDKNKEEPEDLMDNHTKYGDSAESNVAESSLSHMQHPKDHYDAEKIIRKQKFCAIDGDPALAKVQRLSWMNTKGSNNEASGLSDNAEANSVFSSDFSCATQGEENQNSHIFTPESDDIDFSSSVLNENLPWLQPTPLHSSDCRPEMYPPSICDSLEKRYSCISSSDNETSSKTVVERYGNAETVLVEVHATQESSSESEDDFGKRCYHIREDFNVLGEADLEQPVLHSLREETSKRELKENVSVSWDESFRGEFSDVPCSTMILEDVPCSSPDRIDGDSECDLTLEYMDQNEIIEDKKDDTVDLENADDVQKSDVSELVNPCEYSDKNFIDNNSEVSPVVLEEIPDIPEITDDSSISAYSSSKEHQSGLISKEDKEDVCMKSKTEDDIVLRHQNDTCSENTDSPSDGACTEQTKPISQTVTGIPGVTALSPARTSTSEVHSLRTKIETIPVHRKRQILNIPAPSSPVEEVRRKFELRATSQKKNTSLEHPPADNKLQSRIREHPPKLDRRHTEFLDIQHSVVDAENTKRKSDGILSAKAEAVSNKRHSEPFSSSSKVIGAKVNSSLPLCSQTTSYSQKAPENKSTDRSSAKNKPVLPSLFTQLKVRKLQSLQGESPTQVVDPWSDPILDMQEDYHPVVCFSELTKIDDTVPETPCERSEVGSVSPPLQHLSATDGTFSTTSQEELSELMDSGDVFISTSPKDLESESVQVEDRQLQNVSGKVVSSELPDKCKTIMETKTVKDSTEDEAVRRERINRIKEERRAQLREKLKSESFRLEAEEKEKIQTKFRFRKDHSRQTVAACTFDSPECLPGEMKDAVKHAELSGANKNMPDGITDETVKANEPQKGSETKLCEYSDVASSSSATCDTRAKLGASHKNVEDPTKRHSSTGDSVAASKKSAKSETFGVSSSADLGSSRRASGMSVPQPLSSVRESKFTSLTDVRDRVAMFERSKDKELCRAGPNGKFPQKQSASSLTPSFVR